MMTHVAHVGLQLSYTFVLRCVEDHREIGEVLLGIDWIVDLHQTQMTVRLLK